MSAGFVHLHVHSQFSFMDGAAPLPALVARAAELEMPALALTDHQGLSGAIRFYQACKAAGIAPIVGCEVVVETAGILGSESDLPPERRLLLPASVGFGRASGSGHHLTLLCRDFTGYRNLCRLLSRTHLRGPAEPSIVSLRDLETYAEGLIALSGCLNGEAAVGRARSRSGTRSRGAAAALGMLRARRLLRRAHAPADRRRASAGGRADHARRRACAAGRGHQQRPLPAARRPPAPRRALGGGRAHGAAGALRPSQRRALAQAGGRDALAVRGAAARLRRHARDRREVPARAAAGRVPLSQRRHPARRDAVLGARQGVVARARAPLRADDPGGDLAAPARALAHRLDGVLGVLPGGQGDRRPRQVGGYPVFGARERRRQHRRLRAGHHRRRPGRPRPALRAVPQPRAPPDARHRRGLRLRPPRRDHRLHLQALRLRARRDGRHRQHDDRAQRRAGGRAKLRAAHRRGQPAVSAPSVGGRAQDPRGARHLSRVRRAPAARRAHVGDAARPRRAARPLPDAPGHAPGRLHHHERPHRELDAAAVGGQGHGGLAVRQGRHRGARPGQDGHSGTADPLGDQPGGRDGARARGRRRGARAVRPAQGRPAGLRDDRLGGQRGDVPARELRPAQPVHPAEVVDVRGHHRADIAVPTRPARGRDDHAVHPPPARHRPGRGAARGHARGARRLLRRHRLPGAGAAGRPRGGRLRACRGRLACAAR